MIKESLLLAFLDFLSYLMQGLLNFFVFVRLIALLWGSLIQKLAARFVASSLGWPEERSLHVFEFDVFLFFLNFGHVCL
jgi:hypothetical protein